jgi:outer membrane cobalamin receptor
MFGLGYYFRNPSLSEIMGGAQSALANPNLKTEKSLKTDLTWSHSGTRLTVFAAKSDNLIQGLIVDESSFQSQNIGKATFMGVEAGYQNQLSRFLFF